jgi:hypothetical protein
MLTTLFRVCSLARCLACSQLCSVCAPWPDVSQLDAEVSAMRMDIDGIVMDYAVKDSLKKKVS